MDTITNIQMLTSEPLFLKKEDWTPEEWPVVCKVFSVTNPAKVGQITCTPTAAVWIDYRTSDISACPCVVENSPELHLPDRGGNILNHAEGV